ncbi:MAG: hypothetical protein WBN97_02240 [Parvibaculum sp.]
MGRATSLLILLALIVLGGVGGVFYLGKAVEPQSQTVVKELPDGQFPR